MKINVTTELYSKLEGLREAVWFEDIPSPTCPEYVEHHNSITKILKHLDDIIDALEINEEE